MLSLARVPGEAPPRGARGARSLSPAAGGALCGIGGSESHLLAAERRGRGRRRGGGERGGGASSLLLPAPTSRGFRSPQLTACTAPPPPARPGLPATPRQPLLQPPNPARRGPARPPPPPPPLAPASLRRALGARRRLDVPGSRLGAPAPLNSPLSQRPAREGQRGGAASSRERARERTSPIASAGSRHHAGLEEEYPHLLAGGRAGER